MKWLCNGILVASVVLPMIAVQRTLAMGYELTDCFFPLALYAVCLVRASGAGRKGVVS